MRINPAALRVIRQRSGYTVTSLAKATGIGQAHLSNIEAGRRKASPEVIVQLAAELSVPIPAIVKDPDSWVAENESAA